MSYEMKRSKRCKCGLVRLPYLLIMGLSVSILLVGNDIQNNVRTAVRDKQKMDPKYIWLQRRQEVQMNATCKHIILFGYMRGGSSILSRSFTSHPDVFFWYEPGDAFYSSIFGSSYWFKVQNTLFFYNGTQRIIPQWESDLFAEYIYNMYTCDLGHLPVETLTHLSTHYYVGNSFKNLEQCMQKQRKDDIFTVDCKLHIAKLCTGNVINPLTNNCTHHIIKQNNLLNLSWTSQLIKHVDQKKKEIVPMSDSFVNHAKCLKSYKESLQICLPELKAQCAKKRLHVAKILRLTMDTVDEIMERLPGAYMIFFVRDPRATVTSRIDAKLMWEINNGDTVREASQICKKMRHDIDLYRKVEQKYPGAMLRIRYEDYILNVNQTLQKIYSHVNEVPPPSVYQDLMKLMYSKSKIWQRYGNYQQNRQNASDSLYKWIKFNSFPMIEGMTSTCMDVLQALGYPLD